MISVERVANVLNVCLRFNSDNEGFRLVLKHEFSDNAYAALVVEKVQEGLDKMRSRAYTDDLVRENEYLYKQIASLKGQVTKLKKKLEDK